MQGGDDGLRALLEASDDRVEPGLLRGLAELGDVRAGDERTPGPGDDDRLHVGVSQRAIHRLDEALTHGVAERVDRRIVHDDEADRASLLQTDDIAHGDRLS